LCKITPTPNGGFIQALAIYYIRAFEEGDRPFRQKVTICELEDGTVIGAIWPGFFRILYCVTGSLHAYLEDEILSWAERRYCGAALKDRSGGEVYVWAYEVDEQRSRLLNARGYSMHTWYMYSGVIDLDAPLPAPRFPQGFKVRPIAAEDIEQKVAFMGASTVHGVPRLEKYFRLMESPTYRQQLDLVVVDSNNQVAAFPMFGMMSRTKWRSSSLSARRNRTEGKGWPQTCCMKSCTN